LNERDQQIRILLSKFLQRTLKLDFNIIGCEWLCDRSSSIIHFVTLLCYDLPPLFGLNILYLMLLYMQSRSAIITAYYILLL
jgi:hypothetical protein